MKKFTTDTLIYYYDKTIPNVGTVEQGEIFLVDTVDAYGNQISSEQVLRTQIDRAFLSGCTGPIGVQGAMPGDTLCVEILDITFDEYGVMPISPNMGSLGHLDRVPDHHTKMVRVKDDYCYFSDDIVFPVRPMIGNIGVASENEGDLRTSWPGDHGSNMDCTEITIGSKVYFPVAKEGAGLAMGDMHASMGDGELCQTGVETPGHVKARAFVYKESIKRPMVETNDNIYTLASAKTLDEAIPVAVEDMVDFIMKKKNLSFSDAYRLVSATCDIQICQIVNPRKTVRCRAPKAILGIHSIFD